MSTGGSLRRYALLKARAADEAGDRAIAAVWRGKQDEIAGTALPDDFPKRAALAAHRYTTREDLVGACEDELRALGFSGRDITAIFAELG